MPEVQQPQLTDPEYALVQAQVAQQLAFLEGQVLREQKDILTQYGDPDLAAATLGESLGGTVYSFGGKDYTSREEAEKARAERARQTLDAGGQLMNLPTGPAYVSAGTQPSVRQREIGPGPTVTAAGENPYSTLKLLAREYGEGITDTNEAYNRSGNLFYGSARAKALEDLAFGYGQAQQEAGLDVQRRLAELQERLALGKMTGELDLGNALLSAYQKKLTGV